MYAQGSRSGPGKSKPAGTQACGRDARDRGQTRGPLHRDLWCPSSPHQNVFVHSTTPEGKAAAEGFRNTRVDGVWCASGTFLAVDS
eukprot:9341014-Alexandrium_andersonii.AAC.1